MCSDYRARTVRIGLRGEGSRRDQGRSERGKEESHTGHSAAAWPIRVIGSGRYTVEPIRVSGLEACTLEFSRV